MGTNELADKKALRENWFHKIKFAMKHLDVLESTRISIMTHSSRSTLYSRPVPTEFLIAGKVREKVSSTPTLDNATVFGPIVNILEDAHGRVARTIHSTMVVTYWLIGREIVEEEQKGQKRADYGEAVVEGLSKRVKQRCGKGFSAASLWNMRKFYQTCIGRSKH
ncbi:MAG: DUF1016 domain-containing protein [Rhodothermaceae bacterium]|nr:DUF1016 domain-containing protein [Rhodothermaceae bacterium]MYC03083.1 DUF1016 domain-containing protein [Rhodothermaceae bacterium]MYI16542.1 DUF1016 domain-containing protein [Rhodothermaceae bacterium]